MKIRGVRKPFLVAGAVTLMLAVWAAGIYLPMFYESPSDIRYLRTPMGVNMPDGSTYGNTPGNTVQGGRVAYCDGWIYYNNLPASIEFYRIRTDGSDKETLPEGFASQISMHDGWLYCLNMDNALCRMRPDGIGWERLTTFSSGYFNIVDGWMFFTKLDMQSDRPEESIWKMRVDGSELSQLYEGFTGSMVAYDGWLYFSAYGDDAFQDDLYRMELDGTNLQKIHESISSYVVTDAGIFFGDTFGLNEMKHDGGDEHQVHDTRFNRPERLNAWGDGVYFTCESEEGAQSLYRFYIVTSEAALVTEGDCMSFGIVGDQLFICERKPSYTFDYYLADLDGSNARLIDTAVAEGFESI